MTNVTENDIRRLSKLAKIGISELNEIETLARKIDNIIDMAGQLKEVDTENVEPMVSSFEEPMVMAKDIVDDGNKIDEIMQNATEPMDGCFTVPKMIEGK